MLSFESDLVFTDPSSGNEKIPTAEYPVRQQSAIVTEDTVCTSFPVNQPFRDKEKNASGTDWEDEPSFRQSDRKRRSSSSGSTPDLGTELNFFHNVCYFLSFHVIKGCLIHLTEAVWIHKT